MKEKRNGNPCFKRYFSCSEENYGIIIAGYDTVFSLVKWINYYKSMYQHSSLELRRSRVII